MCMHMYINTLYVFSATHAFRLLDVSSTDNSQNYIYLEQSVVDYICICNLSMNVYYYSKLGPTRLNWPPLDLTDQFSTPMDESIASYLSSNPWGRHRLLWGPLI